ncbi:uncharacterized protein LOC128167575 [Crassostrea angulata]|uniref:uncharacterized protein n=1 Tax=Magallana gigas TaxID=29159 RepID=UPI0005C3C3F2|nr:uncharacterized protein LOC128167575 [Crassostrea angulata]|eukprot:XP_011423514.1 PREDICTED: uncharacterized protein LOC105325579 [Crassostrea gigas]
MSDETDWTMRRSVVRGSRIAFIWGIFLISTIESTTLCVQCNSGHDEHCEYNPPAASDCLERINQRNGCLVTRIYTNGKQTAFIRSCSALDPSVAREGCFNDTSTHSLLTKCYILCFQDGCNGSYVISGHVFLVAFVSVLSYFIHYGRNIL